jgi:hypothetical protein
VHKKEVRYGVIEGRVVFGVFETRRDAQDSAVNARSLGVLKDSFESGSSRTSRTGQVSVHSPPSGHRSGHPAWVSSTGSALRRKQMLSRDSGYQKVLTDSLPSLRCLPSDRVLLIAVAGDPRPRLIKLIRLV